VKLAANRVGEVLHGPAPLPAPLPSHVTRGYLEDHRTESTQALASSVAAVVPAVPTTVAEVAASYADTSYDDTSYGEPAYSEPAYAEASYAETAYAEPTHEGVTEAGYIEPSYAAHQQVDEVPAYQENGHNPSSDVPAVAPVDPPGWSSYAPSGSVLPGERNSWS